jgi:glycopeptide antibiotics resistance protein
MTLKRAFLTLAILWTLGIMTVCWVPISLFGSDDGPGRAMFDIPYFDKVVHFGIFLVFAMLWHLATTGSRQSLQIVVWGIGLAILTEVVQKLPIVGRQSDIDDAACDIAGVLLGVLIFRWLAATTARKLTPTLAETPA